MSKVVITGCSSGLGKEMALWGRQVGWEVFASVRDEAAAPFLKERGCEVGVLDLRDSDSITRFVARVLEWSHGKIEGLVNNAGVVFGGPLEFVGREDLREQFEVNVFGPMELTVGLLPLLREGAGSVVMVSSVSSALTFPLYGPYSSSKRALEALSEALLMELEGEPVTIALIQPGSHQSSIWEKCQKEVAPWLEDSRYGSMARGLNYFAGHKRLPPPVNVATRVFEVLEGRRGGYRHLLPASTAWQWRLRRWFPDGVYFGAVRRLLRRGDLG